MLLLLAACTAASSGKTHEAPAGDTAGDTATDTGADPGDTADPADTATDCSVPAGAAASLDLTGVSRGATVDLGSLAIPDQVPTLPVTRADTGGPLLFSDSPEYVAADGILYQDRLDGPGRVYVYHANDGAPEHRMTVLLTGTGTAATVTIRASGLAGPWYDYLYTGRMAALRWETARATPPAPVTVAVPASGTVLLDAALDALSVPDQWLVHAIYDLDTDAPVTVTVASVSPGVDATTARLSALARDGHDRGTFTPSERRLTPTGGCYDPAAGALRVRVAGGTDEDPWATGVDALTGTSEELLGNYGVHYELNVPLRGEGRVALFLAPRGGDIVGATWVEGEASGDGVFDFPTDADVVEPDGHAALLGVWDAATADAIVARFTPAGSTSLPMDAVLVPVE